MVKIEQRGSKFFDRRIGGKRRRAVINKNPYRGIDRLWARLAAPKFAKYSVELLEKMKNGEVQGKVIFIGQGMRPYFETITALNRELRFVPRKRIRYFIYSSSDPHREYVGGVFVSEYRKPHYEEGEAVDALLK